MPREGTRCLPGCTCKKRSYTGKASSEEERRERRAETFRRFHSGVDAEKRREYARRYREEHPEWANEVTAPTRRGRSPNRPHRPHAANDPEYKRNYHLRSKYGITVDQYDELFTGQGGCCYLCDDPLVKGATHIDHDHGCCPAKSRSCGNCIRGLACQKCNQGIGQFGDDPERMRRAADRLEKANAAIRGRSGPVRPTQEMLPFDQVA